MRSLVYNIVMNLNNLASKKVAILGVGIEGLALAEYLRDKCKSVTLLDQKDEASLIEQNINLRNILEYDGFHGIFGENYLFNLKQYDLVFRSPGFRYLSTKIQDALKEGVEISSQIKLFFDLCPCSIIGVTGTKGKGTTSSLIYEILKKDAEIRISKSESAGNIYLAGNIGKPAVTLLPALTEKDTVVLELSSFQLQDLHASPHIAVILNVSSDHLDYHSDNSEYLEAKSHLIQYQEKDDIVIVNRDYANSVALAKQSPAKKYYFSGKSIEGNSAYVRDADDGIFEVLLAVDGNEELICRSDEVQLFGRHNMENIAAASLATCLATADIFAIKEAVRGFQGLPHRLEYVGELSGIKIFNDSFSTNPEPTMAAVRAFNAPELLILGGSSKGADFDGMAQVISDTAVRAVALIGDESDRIKYALIDKHFDGRIIEAGYDFNKAIVELLKSGQAGDVLIFSPACASFDMFKNYKDRGEKFKSIIIDLNLSKY